MIVKLCNPGVVEMCIEVDKVFQQPTESGLIDLELMLHGTQVGRYLIGEDDGKTGGIWGTTDGVWARAYIMENGKTVDTIRQRRENK